MDINRDSADTYWFLTRWEWEHGLIGLAELLEREEVLQWLKPPTVASGGTSDPRNTLGGESERPSVPSESSPASPAGGESAAPERRRDDGGELALMPLVIGGNWVFTKDDDDSYPSVPHGHFQEKTRPWPKLNPYSGKVFSRKDVEDTRSRLTRDELVRLWNDEKFRQHSLATIVWYEENHLYFVLPVSHPHRLPRRRR